MKTIQPASPFPNIIFDFVSGESRSVADYLGQWVMLIVYRGHHCPRCKTYIKRLHALANDYEARNVKILLAVTDPANLVLRTIEENQWTLPVAHSLTSDQCKQLSLYLSPHAPDSDAGQFYAEPGLFIINPTGETQVIETSNSPSVRPDLDVVLDGIIGTQERNLPIRGTYID